MAHIKTFSIKQYRGIKNAVFENLADVNLFVGENNIGKTSLLEAVKLASNPLSKIEYINVARMRERHILTPFHKTSLQQLLVWMYPLAYKTTARNDIILGFQLNENKYSIHSSMTEEEYEVMNEDGQLEMLLSDYGSQKVTKIGIHSKVQKNEQIIEENLTFESSKTNSLIAENANSNFKTTFITAIDHRVLALSPNDVNELIKSGDRPILIHALQLFDPKITGIELLIEDITDVRQRPTPYIEHETLGLVPIAMFGDGLRKALIIASRIIRSKNSVLLIDEIETGIHTKIIPKFFEWLMDMCKLFNVQIFATTHSLEALDGMLLANQAHLERLSVYRLEDSDNGLAIRHFSGEKLNKLRNVLGQDVR